MERLHFLDIPPATVFLYIFVTFLLTKTIVKFYLIYRNKIWININRNSVPKPFAEKINLTEHQKAADYSMAQINSGVLFSLVDLFVLFIWTVGGGLNFLNELLLSTTTIQNNIINGVIFVCAFSLAGLIIGLPEEIYHTFVLEEKYGFNRTTIKTFLLDHLKQLLLSALLGIPIFALLIYFMNTFANWWIWAFISLTVFQIALMWVYPILIAPLFNKFTLLSEGEIKKNVQEFLGLQKFPYKGLFVMDASRRSSHGNAYFTGFGKNRRVVFYDTLINNLTANEVVAVLAHEIGHYRYKHVIKYLLLSILSGGVSLFVLWYLSTSEWFYLAFSVTSPSNYLALVIFSLIVPTFTFFFTPLFSWMSRRHEFVADEYASTFSNAEDLISALTKMFKDNSSTLTPDPYYSLFYYSHPDAVTRVNYLQKMVRKNGNIA